MASGAPVTQILAVMPPGGTAVTMDVRPGGSSPSESVQVWDFDASTTEYLDFKAMLVGYDSGGITWTLPWSASSATGGTCTWGVSVRRMNDDAEDIDNSHAYTFKETDDIAPSASGELSYPTVVMAGTATSLDSWADGEVAIIRVRRNTGGNDNMSGDAELWDIVGKET